MKKNDIFLISSIIFLIIIIFIGNNIINNEQSDVVEVYVDDKIYKTIPIDSEEDLNLEIGESYNLIKIHDGGVEIIDASCKDKVCVHTGFISKSSERIVCMPNKIVIKIKAVDESKNTEDVISK